MMKNRKYIKILIITIIIMASAVVIKNYSLEELREYVSSYGRLSPLIYIILFSVLPIFFFPVPIFALVSGIIFGVVQGTIYTLIAVLINTTIMFYLGRYLGEDLVQKILINKVSANLKSKLLSDNQSILTGIFFAVRLIPLVSYNIINYVAGLTNIKYKNYIISTILGVVPGTVVFLNVGDKSLDIRSREFFISIIYLIILSLVSFIVLNKFVKSDKYD